MRKTAAGVVLGVGAAAIVLALAATGLLDKSELDLYDWRMRTVATVPPDVSRDIVIVELNDTTIRDLDPVFGRWPWPRAAVSLLVDFLNRAPAKVIALDFAFTEGDRVLRHRLGSTELSGEESDEALAASIAAAPATILLADATYEGLVSGGEMLNKPSEWTAEPYRLGPGMYERSTITTPFPKLSAVGPALGHNYAILDGSGGLRRIPPFVRVGDRFMPSLGVAAALRGLDVRPEEVILEGRTLHIRDRRVPLLSSQIADGTTPGAMKEQLTMLVNYRAPALLPNGEKPYTSYEVRHLINSEIQLLGDEKPDLDPLVFKDKIVFVGLTASGLVDIFQSPFDSKGQGRMPGVQMHASIADSILSNRFIRPAGRAWSIAATVATAIVVGLLAAFFPFQRAAPGALAVMAVSVFYAVTAFKGGLWINMIQPMSAMALALFSGTAYQYFVEGREKRQVKRLFGRYVSKDVYDQLIAHPERAELGGKRRDMSVLFSDIRGFTTITEKGQPEELVGQLNEYFSRMVTIVFRHEGTVDKFVGDMVMALFGAPLDDPAHAEHAAQTAVDMVHELGELNRKWAAEGRAQLDIGIGVNSGEMIAGNIGSSSIMSYTVIGDNVNLGARLESLNKDYKTRIIISDATRTRLTGSFDIQPLGDVTVKGKTQAVAIFEIRVPSPMPEAPAAAASSGAAASGGGAPRASNEEAPAAAASSESSSGAAAASGGGAPRAVNNEEAK
ncbi:MAG: adenylate/guanylate cyclase domain-containing protein [Vicinamibacterales bacterium]